MGTEISWGRIWCGMCCGCRGEPLGITVFTGVLVVECLSIGGSHLITQKVQISLGHQKIILR